jgi:hypothetical protein
MSTLITKVRWGDCHKMTIKCTSCLLYYCRRTFGAAPYDSDVVSDANLNTLVELSDVQFTEVQLADTILKRPIMWVARLTGV